MKDNHKPLPSDLRHLAQADAEEQVELLRENPALRIVAMREMISCAQADRAALQVAFNNFNAARAAEGEKR